MNVVQKILKNIGVTAFSSLFTNLLLFILLIYSARYFGEAKYGIYSFALSFTLLFTIFADLGMTQYSLREIARDKKTTDCFLSNTILIKILLAFITFGLITITISLMNYSADLVIIVCIFGIYNILISFSQLFTSIFQAYEKMEYSSLVHIIEKTVLIILGLFVIFSGYGLLEFSYVYLISAITSMLLGGLIVIKKVKPKIKINIGVWKGLITKSIPFGINTVFAMIYFKIDTVLLAMLSTSVAVGIYNAAYNPLLSLTMITTGIVITAIYPVMSRYFIHAKDSLKKLTTLSLKYMAIIGFPIGMGCFVLADKFILLFYGGQFLNSILAFQILALFIPIRLISSVTGTFLSSTNKQNVRTIIVAACAILNLILNIILIPTITFIGASIATVISEFLLYILYFKYMKIENRLKTNLVFLKPLLASLIMGVLIYHIKDFNLLFVVMMGAASYFIIIFALKTFTSEDKAILRQIISR